MTYYKQIRNVITKKKDLFNIGSINSIKFKDLGTGENNQNTLVRINNEVKVIFRIGLRKELEQNMKREFYTLKLVPEGFGPNPIYFDNSKKIIPKVYSILNYLEGRHIQKWSKKHLAIHIKKLAELHKQTSPYWGTQSFKDTNFDLFDKLKRDSSRFAKISTLEGFEELSSRIYEYIKNNNHYFTSLKKFSLIHGDACVSNILFFKDKVHYIDWEWSSFRDPAEDLATLYYPTFTCMPWLIKLDETKQDFLIKTYLKYRKDKTLKKRVKIWNVFLRYQDLLYFQYKLYNFEKEPKTVSKKELRKIIGLLYRSLKKDFNIK